MGYSHIFWALFWKMRKVDWWYDITAKIHPGSPFPEQAQEMPCVTQPPNHPETLYSGSLDLITWMPPTLKAVQKSFVTPTRIYCVAQGTIFKIWLIIYNRKECKKEYTHTHTYTYTSHTHTHTYTHTHTHTYIYIYVASQVALAVKNLSVNAGDIRDTSSIPGSGRSPGGGHGNPLQYSWLENPMDRGAWWLQSIGLQRVGYDWSDLAHVSFNQ